MSDTVEAAKAPGVFSLDQFLAGVAYPVEEVTVFTDAFSVNELLKLRGQRAEAEGKLAKAEQAKRSAKKEQRTISGDAEPTPVVDPETLEALQDDIDKLDAQVAKSALHFKLRGMPPHIVEAVTKKHFTDPKKEYENTPEESARDYELVAKTIIGVTDVDGNTATEEITPEYVEKLKGALLSDEYGKIIRQVAHVNLNGALFDEATDASFLSGRSDVAG